MCRAERYRICNRQRTLTLGYKLDLIDTGLESDRNQACCRIAHSELDRAEGAHRVFDRAHQLLPAVALVRNGCKTQWPTDRHANAARPRPLAHRRQRFVTA